MAILSSLIPKNQPKSVAQIFLDFIHGLLEILAEFQPGESEEIGLHVHVSDDEATIIGFDTQHGEIFVNGRKSGNIDFHPSFAGSYHGPPSGNDGPIRLHIFVDWSSIEVFAQDGSLVFTHRIFPRMESDHIELYAKGGPAHLVSLDVWKLDSIWK